MTHVKHKVCSGNQNLQTGLHVPLTQLVEYGVLRQDQLCQAQARPVAQGAHNGLIEAAGEAELAVAWSGRGPSPGRQLDHQP